MRAEARNVADNGLAHERRGEWDNAATDYERAAALFAESRDFGQAEDMHRRALTCRAVVAAVAAHTTV